MISPFNRACSGGLGGVGGILTFDPIKVSAHRVHQTDSFRASKLKLPPLPPIPPKSSKTGPGGWLHPGIGVAT